MRRVWTDPPLDKRKSNSRVANMTTSAALRYCVATKLPSGAHRAQLGDSRSRYVPRQSGVRFGLTALAASVTLSDR
jgi:hypothetical protein